MKKLVVAAMAIAMGIAAQAANVNWNSGTLYLPNPDGTWSTTKATSTTAGTWSLVVAFYDSTGADFAAGGALSDDSISALNALNGTATGFEASKNYYMSAVLTYTTDDYTFTKEFEKVAFSTKSTGATAANMQVDTVLATKMIDTTTPLGWTITSNVPEPTSGLLLLLGVAGLALKRRRA